MHFVTLHAILDSIDHSQAQLQLAMSTDDGT